MNQTVNPYLSDVAKVFAGVPAGCVGEDENCANVTQLARELGIRRKSGGQRAAPAEAGSKGEILHRVHVNIAVRVLDA
jgi:hypothetical protein